MYYHACVLTYAPLKRSLRHTQNTTTLNTHHTKPIREAEVKLFSTVNATITLIYSVLQYTKMMFRTCYDSNIFFEFKWLDYLRWWRWDEWDWVWLCVNVFRTCCGRCGRATGYGYGLRTSRDRERSTRASAAVDCERRRRVPAQGCGGRAQADSEEPPTDISHTGCLSTSIINLNSSFGGGAGN